MGWWRRILEESAGALLFWGEFPCLCWRCVLHLFFEREMVMMMMMMIMMMIMMMMMMMMMTTNIHR